MILLTKDLMNTTPNFEMAIINTNEPTKALINREF
jgi:hypothetical protein